MLSILGKKEGGNEPGCSEKKSAGMLPGELEGTFDDPGAGLVIGIGLVSEVYVEGDGW